MTNNLNAIDIETFGSTSPRPYCFSIVYRGIVRSAYGLDCISKALLWLFSNCSSGSIFFAHNLNFDGSIILCNLPPGIELIERGTLLHGGDIYSLALVCGCHLIFLRCSFKILPLDLSSIAALLSLPPKLDFNHMGVDVDTIRDPAFKNRTLRYCERDATIVHRFMGKIGLSLSNMAPRWWVSAFSISGIALRVYRLNFNIHNIVLELDKKIDDSIRPAYYGGRCEVFGNPRLGEFIFHFDFSGMYTNRLRDEFPVDTPVTNHSPSGISRPGFYFVNVNSNLPLPILPFRDSITGKLTFPNGIFEGLYWYEELLLFVENGGVILKIYYSFEFSSMGYAFKNFAETCSKLRKNDLASKTLWKIIPNSFVGRLGLKDRNEETILLDDAVYDPTKIPGIIGDRKINTKWIVRLERPSNTLKARGNVIYPAIVTAKARILWWKSARNVEAAGGRLFYCDTDSIFAGFNRDVGGESHGEILWDVTKPDTIILDACFATSKVYCIKYSVGAHTKIKGVPSKEASKMTIADFKDLFYSNMKGAIKMSLFNKNFLDMQISEIHKIIDFGAYDKRLFSLDKTTTTPLTIKYPI